MLKPSDCVWSSCCFPGKTINPHLLFHSAATNVICQVLFARHFDYDDEFLQCFVVAFHDTGKLINGFWGLVSHIL